MAFLDPNASVPPIRGRVGNLIFSKQQDGRVTVRQASARTAEWTEAEKKGQRRLPLANLYMKAILGDPVRKAAYATEARARHKRTCDLIKTDFLTAPLLTEIDPTGCTALPRGCIRITTGDAFKVIHVQVALRDGAGAILEEGAAVRAADTLCVWVYTMQLELPAGQTVKIDVTASDRPGKSTTKSVYWLQPAETAESQELSLRTREASPSNEHE